MRRLLQWQEVPGLDQALAVERGKVGFRTYPDYGWDVEGEEKGSKTTSASLAPGGYRGSRLGSGV